MDQSWRDPTAAWWAKAARAAKHIRDVDAIVGIFEQSRPYEISRQTNDNDDGIAYHFHVVKPWPIELLTTVGDALHNMRSCLDSVAYELANRHLKGQMSNKQQRAAQFPICETGHDFDEFFDKNSVRSVMYGQQERLALRCVQPFAMREEMAAHGVQSGTTADFDYITNELHRLSVLNNVDKHRRLPLLSWYLDFLYWNREDCEWRGALPNTSVLEDGILLGHLKNPSKDPDADATFEVKLSLIDDPGYRQDLPNALRRWHEYLVAWVLPRMFIVADGNPPPIVIARP